MADVFSVIISVLGCSALLAWGMWLLYKRFERAERDPKYVRRLLMRQVIMYGCSAVIGTVLVATGKLPKESLIGLPIVALLCWINVRAAARIKATPNEDAS
jgi:hypothetical protein